MYKKLRKLIKKPNLFFYDYFAKRLGLAPYNGSATFEKRDIESGIADVRNVNFFSAIEHASFDCLYLLKKIFAFKSGVVSGYDDQSILLQSNQLRLFILACIELAAYKKNECRFFSLGSIAYFKSLKIDSPFDRRLENDIYNNLISKSDFVVEFEGDSSISIHVFLYDITSEKGEFTIRSSRAYIKKGKASEIEQYFPARNAAHFPIDVVYTWVNRDDPKWLNSWMETFPDEIFDPDRFTCNHELRYSLKALYKYAPWIRNVYVVSNCERPEYLKSEKKVIWVDHADIFPNTSFLPTFNSHAIESCLHRIAGLSEHFIYLNDDVFLNQPCYPSDFFDCVGRSISFLEPYGMVAINDDCEEEIPDYLKAANNSGRLLKEKFPFYDARQLHMHVPFALRKSVLQELENLYPSEFYLTRLAKLRSNKDLNVTSFLYHHFAMVSGSAIPGSASSLIVRPNNIQKILQKNNDLRYRFLCFNDGNGSSLNSSYKDNFSKYCTRRFRAELF